MAEIDQPPDGRNGSSRASNVIQLRPRPWLESESELVPIEGTTAEPAGDEMSTSPAPPRDVNAPRAQPETPEERGHTSTWLGASEETVPIARAATRSDASDFWGEDAAYVQDALEAPIPAPRGEDPAAREPREPVSPRRLLRAPALAAIAIAALAVSAAAIESLGSAPVGPRHSPRISSLHAASSAGKTGAAWAAAAAAAAAEAKSGATVRRADKRAAGRTRGASQVRPQSHARATSSRRRLHRAHGRSTVTGTATAVRYVAPAPARTPTPTPATVSPPPTENAGTPTQASTASSSSPPGPTGTVSLIGAGTSPSG